MLQPHAVHRLQRAADRRAGNDPLSRQGQGHGAQALECLDPQRIWLASNRGPMTASRALAQQKLKVMVEAARRLRRRSFRPYSLGFTARCFPRDGYVISSRE
jgi:hypothetical protein